MKFSLDKEKAVELAKKLDINVTFNNSKSGITISDNGNLNHFDFESFFPELEQNENFITKDKDFFLGETPIKKPSTIVITLNTQQSITISNSKKLTGAA